jgi:hypothetical protein
MTAMCRRWNEVEGKPICLFGFLVALVVAPVLVPMGEATSQPSRPAEPMSVSGASATLGEGISGWVIGPNGRPVAGAQVGLNADAMDVIVRNGILEKVWPGGTSEKRIVETNAEGQFHLGDSPSDPFFLLAAGKDGFALVMGKEFKKNHQIRLERWGRIEGQLAKGRKGSDGRVWMTALPNPAWLDGRCAFRYDTRHAEDGHFVFEKVPAGWFEVGYLVATADDCEGFTSRTPVEVKAGETAQVRLGGQGRPVIGRFVPPASYDRSVYFGAGVRALQRQEKMDPNREQPRQQWWRAWEHDAYDPGARCFDARTPDYCIETTDNEREWTRRGPDLPDTDGCLANAAWRDANWRGYAFRINSDGSFRVEDVIAGKYDLRVDLEAKDRDSFTDRPFAEYRGTIEVPTMKEAYTDRPFDLGNLTLNVHGVGGPAPLFESETVYGKPIRLIDMRGKFVLLHFWDATIYEDLEDFRRVHHVAGDIIVDDPCDLDRLRELHRTYGANGCLQIIGINQSDSPGKIKAFDAEHKIEWPEIRTGAAWDKGIAGQYGAFRVPFPYIVLVDPAGKIDAVGLRGKGLTNTVRHALAGVP